MKKIIFALSIFSISCATDVVQIPIKNDFIYYEGDKLPRVKVMDHWLTRLSEKNLRLYVHVANATVASERSNKKVYILKSYAGKTPVYKLSYKTGHGQNLITIDANNNEVVFEHYNDEDGPSLTDSMDEVWLDMKIKKINFTINKSLEPLEK